MRSLLKRWLLALTIAYLVGQPIFAAAQVAYDPVANNKAAQARLLAQQALAAAQVKVYQYIGTPNGVTPVATSTATANTLFMMADPVGSAGIVKEVRIAAQAAGTIQLARYSKSGSTYSLVNTTNITVPAAGTLTLSPTSAFNVAAGDYVGIIASGVMGFTSGSAWGAGWQQYGGVSTPSATLNAAVSIASSPRLAVSFTIESTLIPPSATDFSALQTQVSTLAVSALKGKKGCEIGDSLSTPTLYGPKWQAAFAARTGSTIAKIDARPGRTWQAALEGYGASSPLASVASLTGYASSTSVTVGQIPQASGTLANFNTVGAPADGTSLATWLADCDYLLIWLNTNDAHTGRPIGTLTDAYTAGTFNGDMNFTLDALLTNKPSLRIIGVTNYQTQGWYSYATGKAYADAAIAQFGARGIPVLDLYSRSGINSLTVGTLVRDDGNGNRIHATDAWLAAGIGPLIAQFASDQL